MNNPDVISIKCPRCHEVFNIAKKRLELLGYVVDGEFINGDPKRYSSARCPNCGLNMVLTNKLIRATRV